MLLRIQIRACTLLRPISTGFRLLTVQEGLLGQIRRARKLLRSQHRLQRRLRARQSHRLRRRQASPTATATFTPTPTATPTATPTVQVTVQTLPPVSRSALTVIVTVRHRRFRGRAVRATSFLQFPRRTEPLGFGSCGADGVTAVGSRILSRRRLTRPTQRLSRRNIT